MSRTPRTTNAAVELIAATRAAFGELLALDLDTCRIAVCLASCLKEEPEPHYAYLQVTDALLDSFREVARTNLTPLAAAWRTGDLLLHPYAAQSRPDEHEVEYLDLAAHPVILEQIAPLADLTALAVFEADREFVAALRFYVIVVSPPEGAPVYCFRTYTPKKELARSRLFAALFRDGQFDTIREPLFLFDQHLDCLSRGSDMFVLKKGHFQSMFRFYELVRRNAHQALETLRASVPIGTFERFAQDCESHLTKLIKLQSIAGKPYLARVTIADMRKVIVRYGLNVEIQMVEGRERIMYDPADKWALLKLL